MRGSTPGLATSKQDRIAVAQSDIQQGADRVFVDYPRLFAFSSRALSSLKHPFLPLAVDQADAELARGKRTFQTKGERLADILTPSSVSFKYQEDRWANVGFMLDSVVFEDQISARREAVMSSSATIRAVETLWVKAGGTKDGGLDFPAYCKLHQFLYTKLLLVNDAALQPLLEQAVQADWELDRSSDSEVNFGNFFLCLLEVADNWMPLLREPEAYAAFLLKVLAAYDPTELGSLEPVPNAKPHLAARDWDGVVNAIKGHAQALEGSPVIKAERQLGGRIVYQKAAL
jgi:hypothetical protein